MAIIRIGVDLAKNVFALHGVDESGRVKMARMVRREQTNSTTEEEQTLQWLQCVNARRFWTCAGRAWLKLGEIDPD